MADARDVAIQKSRTGRTAWLTARDKNAYVAIPSFDPRTHEYSYTVFRYDTLRVANISLFLPLALQLPRHGS
jgi:hypothetical protein